MSRPLDPTKADPDSTPREGGHPKATELTRGAAVGRLMILRRLGVGGMGVVYGAYDAELDRKVALKLLIRGKGTETARTRLLREAQALAKLGHPNVVAIHDVGTHEGQVWLSMEFVDGKTLGDWRTLANPGWRQVLAVMLQAARGLVAAHDAGLLHRDIKPDNIMVGDDGRVRVMDFGLARAGGDESGPQRIVPKEPKRSLEPGQPRPFEARVSALSIDLTAAGAVMGTPAYMAPEQFHGLVADERTDQFSLCATLWEALYGQRAFRGETMAELCFNVCDGNLAPPPSSASVPRWLRRVMERGMAKEREDRYASIDDLIAALEADPTRRRRTWGLGVAAALGAVAWLGVTHVQREQAVADCEAAGASIAEVWSDTSRNALKEGLRSSSEPYAQTSADNVLPYFDAQAEAWREARTDSCLDTRVHDTWDEDTLDRAVWCLDDRRMELEALVSELSEGKKAAVRKAVGAAARLSQIEPCRDPLRLRSMPPIPDDREAVRELGSLLSRATALDAAGDYNGGLEVARKASAAAEKLDWAPLRARAEHHVGTLLKRIGKYPEAEQVLEAAYFQAMKASAFEEALDTAVTLSGTVTLEREHYDDGLRWSLHAEALLEVLGEEERGLRRAAVSTSIASARSLMGELEQAKQHYVRALSIQEKILGPEHPNVAIALSNLATLHGRLGEFDEAKALLRRALSVHEKTVGLEHPRVAGTLNNLAIANNSTGDYERAKALYQRALEIRRKTLPPGHPRMARSLANLAVVHRNLGEYERARELAEQALGIQERKLRADHPLLATSLENLAAVLVATQDYDGARTRFERALKIHETAHGADDPRLVGSLNGLAEVALAQGRAADAIAPAERASSLHDNNDGAAPARATTHLLLARALWEAPVDHGRDRERARALAEQAREELKGAKGRDGARAQVEAFLSAATAPPPSEPDPAAP
ncbi:MAG: serine/threonine-protein kinase [Myxococcota bacterium]